MPSSIQAILKKYWGYSSFRPLQENIIHSVLSGKDTLALLPTGGGKSICFQVPALAQDGICIVVSPLIALMLDQVSNLKKKDIKSMAIWSGLSKKEVDISLDNCVYGDYKFLYVSPERLTTSIFRERFQKMPVNLIAIDEAHCISQWGYDFRPPYLQIVEIRKYHPHIPVLALTATATPAVSNDIQEKLEFREKNIFQASFARKNIHFIVREYDDKETKLLEIIKSVPGCGIVYVRNRKKTKDIADILRRNNISADHYHAGLTNDERATKQKLWIENKIRIIVCTNAFGMGIDKPDVRIVVHYDVPESPEAYYQEAGRAGRDGKAAYAGLLFYDSDITQLKNYADFQYPSADIVQKVYHALGNYFQIAIGAGKDESYDFDLIDFCERYKMSAPQTANALRILEKQAYVYMSDDIHRTSTIMVATDKETLYRFQVENKKWDHFIKTILRLIPGIFDETVPISEKELAFHMSLPEQTVKEQLLFLHKQNIFYYYPVKTKPQLIMLTERLKPENLYIDKALIKTLKDHAFARAMAMHGYITNKIQCRMQFLLHYFGESHKRCGACDICVERNKLKVSEKDFKIIYHWMFDQLKEKPQSPEKIYKLAAPVKKDILLETISYMKDNKIIMHTQDNLLVWKG